MVEIWEANAHNHIILASHNISALLCKRLLHFRLTPSTPTPTPTPSYGLANLTPHINLLHPLRAPIFFFPPLSLFSSPSSLSLSNKKKSVFMIIYFCIIFVFLARTFEFLPISNPRDQERM